MLKLIALSLLLVNISTTLGCLRVGPDKKVDIEIDQDLLAGDRKLVFHLGGITDPGTFSEAQIVMGNNFPKPRSFVEAKFRQRRPEKGSDASQNLYSHIESAMQSNISVNKFGRKAEKSFTILTTSMYNSLRPGMYKEYMERVEFHFKDQDVHFFIERMAEKGESAFFMAEASQDPRKVQLSTLNEENHAATDILFNCLACRHIRLAMIRSAHTIVRPNYPLLKAEEPKTKFEILFAASPDENGLVVSAKLDEFSESNIDIILKPNNPLTVKTRGYTSSDPYNTYVEPQNGENPSDITGNSAIPFQYLLYCVSYDGHNLQVTINQLPNTAFSVLTDEQRLNMKENGTEGKFKVELKENFKYGFSYFEIALPAQANPKASLIVAVTDDDENWPCNPGLSNNNDDPRLPSVISGNELGNISYTEPEITEQGTDEILENISKHLTSSASRANRHSELLIFCICALFLVAGYGFLLLK
ncbi:hypothetical protein QYM36_017278 [Artemia franciscana]|uniref:Uncharacterized protein n=1 Tax=Artemia franciscana TaxID=6661 RepID=A0AA88HDS5_ARTSF|nr:hypothetical protein QYM36_017278 [Artemia franciscana]